MKTSNYILTGFLTFGFVIILTLFIDARVHGKNSKKSTKEYVTEEKLEPFSVIVAQEQSNIVISSRTPTDNENIIRSHVYALEAPKNQQSPKKFFRISNDTMFVKKAVSVDRLIIYSNSIKKIIGKKWSKINVWSYTNDTLSIDLNQSKLVWSSTSDDINYCNIEAKNHSDIRFTPTVMYKKLDNGKKKMIYKQGLKHLKVSLKNHSKLNAQKPKRIDIEADSTSIYNIFK